MPRWPKKVLPPSEQQAKDAEKLVRQIEDGSFRVDQKWLLTELIKCYMGNSVKDKLKALQMIKEIGGYNESTGDEKAVVDSLMESLANERTE